MNTTLKLLALSTVILLSSCETSNMLVLKRKYTKGYYVDFGNKRNNKISEIKESKANTETNVQEDAVQQESVNAPLMASNDNKIHLPSNTNKLNLFQTYVSKQNASIENSSLPSEKTKSKLISRINKKINKANSTTKTNNDTELIVMVILAIIPFLSLLAMYLHDGKSITLNFLVNLLLHLTFIGYAIFGVLVVLDIINLA